MPIIQHDVEGHRYSITIPIEVVKQKKWIKGSTLFFNINTEGTVELKKKQ